MTNPYHINSANPGPAVLITAGVHGDEYEPMLAAIRLVNALPGMLACGSVKIVPIVNTSAANADNRCGTDGLDLARICPGNTEGTISEVSAAGVSKLIKEADYLIDMHTGGKAYNICPLAGYLLHPSPEVLKKQQDIAIAFNLPVVWGTEPTPAGRTLSVARDANVPAIYVEYGGGSNAKPEIVQAYEQGCLNVLRSLDMIAKDNAPAPKVKYWIEDYTPDMGHLQVKLPAPAQGIFVTTLQPGEMVKKGQLWGKIIDVSSNHQTEVLANEDGIVLLIRAAAYVKAGDSLGGILANLNTSKVTADGK